MDTDKLDPGSRMPLYRQLAAVLRDRITSGTYAGRLPGERHMAAEHGLAVGTVRKALAVLREEGLIETLHGIGSFCTSR